MARDLRHAAGLSVLGGLLWPVQAAAIAWAVSGWVAGAAMSQSWIAAAIIVVAALAGAVLEHRAGRYLHRAADVTIAREREALIRREARMPSGIGSAAIATLAVQKLPLLEPWITRYRVAMARVAVLPLVYAALVLGQSWLAALVLLVSGPLIPVFMALVGMAAEDASRRQMDEIGTMNGMLMERLAAMLDIRLLGATDRSVSDFAHRAEALRAATMRVLAVAFLSSTVLELFAAIGVALVAVFVGFTLLGEIGFGGWGAPLTLGEGIFILLLAPAFYQPLRDLAAAWHDRAAGFAVVAELEALDAEERVSFTGGALPADPVPGRLSLRTEGAVARLAGRSVTIPDLSVSHGDTLALTGPSGAGKSTALAAMAGLVRLERGQIVVCGRSLDDGTADGWRARIGFVPQRVHFSDGTLGAWLDPGASGADPWPALVEADADGIVRRLTEGLETRLGETGGGVSGGEARRLLIARAILSGGDLLLADEPTADLDPDTTARVIATFRRLRDRGRTIVVATHDPALADAMAARVEVTG